MTMLGVQSKTDPGPTPFFAASTMQPRRLEVRPPGNQRLRTQNRVATVFAKQSSAIGTRPAQRNPQERSRFTSVADRDPNKQSRDLKRAASQATTLQNAAFGAVLHAAEQNAPLFSHFASLQSSIGVNTNRYSAFIDSFDGRDD